MGVWSNFSFVWRGGGLNMADNAWWLSPVCDHCKFTYVFIVCSLIITIIMHMHTDTQMAACVWKVVMNLSKAKVHKYWDDVLFVCFFHWVSKQVLKIAIGKNKVSLKLCQSFPVSWILLPTFTHIGFYIPFIMQTLYTPHNHYIFRYLYTSQSVSCVLWSSCGLKHRVKWISNYMMWQRLRWTLLIYTLSVIDVRTEKCVLYWLTDM